MSSGNSRTALLVGVLALGLLGPARSQEAAAPEAEALAEEPTVITSEKLTFDQAEGYALFEENVVVKDARMTLTADRLRVMFDKEGKAETIEATGNVHIVQPERESRSGVALYEVASGRIVLSDEPRITQGLHSITAERITIWRNQSRMIAYPKPVLRIFPDERTRDLF